MLNVNEYFTGKVKSIGFDSGSIGRASVGVMEAGEYTFGTGQAEEMTVITGALKVLLPGAPDWEVFMPGESFFVPAQSEFNLQVADASSYLCKYL
ncbi:pyrimidine/purine nucleoside phosphorylase [Brenneria rubrifaciens]|uniref:Pyrimidine/purine nucleoside phosphorylase n=1 Tax=Brenneria rubrifaciens TaxID=55213 RepID=A0A4P8QRC7_9GAMM|nr:pyrimidine/purine nucleoside phosphorylase [Brenneria rubrifaciens]QCR07840.1 pyrimidine/purine nucleoside phosphorylase [Brenneria rubrifaciens]